jgi:hypothetical protein
MQPNYDDSTWRGPSNALLYVEGAALPAPKNTLLSLYDLNYPTNENRLNVFYFRQKFVAPIGSTNVMVRLRHIIDDGLVLHLNGVEIYRSVLMAPGAVTAATQATAAIGDAALLGPFNFVVTNLVGGTNVLAAEVHQNGTASSDIVFGTELSFTVASEILTNPAVQIVTQPQSRTNAVGTIASFTVGAINGDPTLFYQWRKNSNAIPGETASTFTIGSVQTGDAGFYDVIVSNSFSSATSSVARLTVTVPCTFTGVPQPKLNYQASGANIVLSWTNPTTNTCGSNAVFTLQQTLVLSNATGTTPWANITTISPYTTPKTNSQRFFRLFKL